MAFVGAVRGWCGSNFGDFSNQKKNGLPLPLGRGVCETKSKNGRSRPRKPFIFRKPCAQRGIETMVREGARPCGRGSSGDFEDLRSGGWGYVGVRTQQRLLYCWSCRSFKGQHD